MTATTDLSASTLDLVALTKRYSDAVAAVDNVSLRIPANHYCCLLGPSGCGKSSTLRMIAGHETVTSGDVLLGGRNITDATGLAFRKHLRGGSALFYVTVASLIMPSIIVSLGIGLQFRLLDNAIKYGLEAFGATAMLEGFGTSLGLFTSALGAHLTWTLPFGLLIMLAVFNRFNRAYEEAAADLGATPWQTFRYVVFPRIAPSVVGIGMFGFTLSCDEIARTSQAIGDVNTLPLELQGLTATVTNPAIYALDTLTTLVSFVVMAATVLVAMWLARKRK